MLKITPRTVKFLLVNSLQKNNMSTKIAQMENPITIMLNITPLTVNKFQSS